MTDLHTRLTAAITARLDVARRASGDRTWWANERYVCYGTDPDTRGLIATTLETTGSHGTGYNAQHIASWDPSTAIRVLEALQEVVERHRLCPADCKHHVDRLWCHAVACFVNSERWPCADIRSVCAALGVEVE